MISYEILFQILDEKLSHCIWNNRRLIAKSTTFHGRSVFQSLETEAQVAISDQVLCTEQIKNLSFHYENEVKF